MELCILWSEGKRRKSGESLDSLNTLGMLPPWASAWLFPLPGTFSPKYPRSQLPCQLQDLLQCHLSAKVTPATLSNTQASCTQIPLTLAAFSKACCCWISCCIIYGLRCLLFFSPLLKCKLLEDRKLCFIHWCISSTLNSPLYIVGPW